MILSYKSKGIPNQVQDDGLLITPVIPDSIRNPFMKMADLFVIPGSIRNPLVRTADLFVIPDLIRNLSQRTNITRRDKGILNQVQDDDLFIISVIPDSIRNPLIRSTGYYHAKS